MRLAQLGADVTIACRNPDKAFAALEDIKAQAPGAQVMYSRSSLPVVRVQGELQDHASCIMHHTRLFAELPALSAARV